MPVVCFCEEDKIGWVADGGVLDARAKEKLVITPGAKSERNVTRANGSMRESGAYVCDSVGEWDSSTEEVARRDFLSKDHIKEMRGIDAWKIIARWHHEGRGRRLGEPDAALAPAKVLQLVLVHIAVLLPDDEAQRGEVRDDEHADAVHEAVQVRAMRSCEVVCAFRALRA